jgi:catechol 2,3-dioxygenase
VTLIEIEQRPRAKPDDPAQAGLYHTAFLMPTRQDHARWIMHIARNQVPISGASDHGVSEAFYLDDPEGNGIEVYNDRPRERWNWENGLVTMPTKQLDIEAIAREVDPATTTYPEAPAGLRIGHVHLRVSNIRRRRILSTRSVDLARRRRGNATFMSSGGYHHHVGANVCAQRRREAGATMTGRAWLVLGGGSRLRRSLRCRHRPAQRPREMRRSMPRWR